MNPFDLAAVRALFPRGVTAYGHTVTTDEIVEALGKWDAPHGCDGLSGWVYLAAQPAYPYAVARRIIQRLRKAGLLRLCKGRVWEWVTG